MARPGNVDYVQLVSFDQTVQMDVDEIEPRCRPPVPQQSGLDVFQSQRLFEQWIIEQIDLAYREVVRRPPVGIQERELGA